MTSELAYEASDEASENELLDRSLSVWRGWSAIEWEDFTPIALDIHTACSIGQYDWVRSLIARNEGLTLDRKNHGGWTPLMYACYIGHDNVVNLLIQAGCHLNLKNPRGHTPLMLAASCGNETVARTLIRNGAELELTDKCGWTALFHATYAGHQNFVAFLLETGANRDAVEPVTGMTPFMEAAAEGHEIIIQLFLQHGVNVNAKAYNGDMARSLALINGFMKIVSLIDHHVLPLTSLRSEPGLDFCLSSSDNGQGKPRMVNMRGGRGKSKGPSIRDGPEAIARMIDRTRNTDGPHFTTPAAVPKGYMSFTGPAGDVKGAGTHLSHRDVTSPINQDDYNDNSGSGDFDDDNDESNAFTKTGAITIKSSSSSSGGLIAALGLSREGSIDSDDSRSVELTNSSSDTNMKHAEECEEDVAKGNGREETSDSSWEASDGSGCDTGAKEYPDNAGDELKLKSKSKKDENILSLSVVPSDDTALGQGDDGGVKENVEKSWAVASPLRDYFPTEVPFQVNFVDAPASVQSHHPPNEIGPVTPVASAAPHQHRPEVTQSLPVDNMSQREIVTRYLNNMKLGSGPTCPPQKNEEELLAQKCPTANKEGVVTQLSKQRQQRNVNNLVIEGNAAQTNIGDIRPPPPPPSPYAETGPSNRENFSLAGNEDAAQDLVMQLNNDAPSGNNTFSYETPGRATGGSVHSKHLNAVPAMSSGPYMQHSDHPGNKNQSSFIAQEPSLVHPPGNFNAPPSNDHGTAPAIDSVVNLPPDATSPFIYHHHHPLLQHHYPPSYLLPPSHLHHHHHHLHHQHDPSSTPHQQSLQQQQQQQHLSHPHHHQQQQQHRYEIPPPLGQEGYLPGGGGGGQGFYDFHHHMIGSHPAATHPYLTTVPPELYYSDLDPIVHQGYSPNPQGHLLVTPMNYTNTPTFSAPPPHLLHQHPFDSKTPTPSHLQPVIGSNSADHAVSPVLNNINENGEQTSPHTMEASLLADHKNLPSSTSYNSGNVPDRLAPKPQSLDYQNTPAGTQSPGVYNKDDNDSTPTAIVMNQNQMPSMPHLCDDNSNVMPIPHKSDPSNPHTSSILSQGSNINPYNNQTNIPLYQSTAAQPNAPSDASEDKNTLTHHISRPFRASHVSNANSNKPSSATESSGHDTEGGEKTQGNTSNETRNSTSSLSPPSSAPPPDQGKNWKTKTTKDHHHPSSNPSTSRLKQHTLYPSSTSMPISTTTSSSSANTVVPQPSVMIPGHVTSQPVSQSLDWLSQNERVGGGPRDLGEMLVQLGLTKYLDKFEEQDVDLAVFLSLTDNDLKELGIKLFGPRKKMTNAIARWHSSAPLSCSELEQAYADRLEGEMQEMAIQLNQAVANEESLKAQVLQEQQLRSVTEGCLMEMRMTWSQARQLIQDSGTTMRTMGELLSRLRHGQKELKKSLVNKMKEWDQIPTTSSSAPIASSQVKDTAVQGQRKTTDRELGAEETMQASLESVKKSEKAVKDLQQALASLIHNADHILKSTQNMNTLDKDIE